LFTPQTSFLFAHYEQPDMPQASLRHFPADEFENVLGSANGGHALLVANQQKRQRAGAEASDHVLRSSGRLHSG
jgi:hypothetical protein